MGCKKKTIIPAVIAFMLALLYIVYDLKGNTGYILPKRVIKSSRSLISMISRLITIDDGEITIDGEDITKAKNKALAKKILILNRMSSIACFPCA